MLTAAQAAAAYHLPGAAIGDYVLLAAPGLRVRGSFRASRRHTEASRTHGSLYEREIPLLAIHPAAGPVARTASRRTLRQSSWRNARIP